MFGNPFRKSGESEPVEQIAFTPSTETIDRDAEYLQGKFAEVLALIDHSENETSSDFERIQAIAFTELEAEIALTKESKALNDVFSGINHAQTPRQFVDALQKLPPPAQGVERDPLLKMIAGI